MPEYGKLTVVKLREELVKRGLPKTGLKAELVQRLDEAEAQAASAAVGPDRTEDGVDAQKNEDVTLNAQVPANSQKEDEVLGKDKSVPEQTALKSGGAEPSEGKTVVAGETVSPPHESQNHVQEKGQDTSEMGHPLSKPSGDTVLEGPVTDNIDSEPSESDVLPGTLTQPPSNSTGSGLQLPTPDQTHSDSVQPPMSLPTQLTQTSITGDEMQEDSRKRKRRSQSPPPSSADLSQKKLKPDDARPHVELLEDSATEGALLKESQDSNDNSNEAGANITDSVSEIQRNGHAEAEEQRQLPDEVTASVEEVDTNNAQESNGAVVNLGELKRKPATPIKTKTGDSQTIKPSPSDTRFKNLFTPPTNAEPPSMQPPSANTEDRVVTPARHPATSALYISELMRPLNFKNVKDHLVSLATPPDAPSSDPSLVTDFYLDSIKTHCLVGFATISAASRVRSSLHNRIWPNERDRRPLWVDFVPEEKLKNWIEVEQQQASGGRGHGQKRWEVVYEDEEGEVKAYLQLFGSKSSRQRAPQAPAGQGVQGAPSGPRGAGAPAPGLQPQPQATRDDKGKGFQALDDLFQSTAAKPKIYYLPPPKRVAKERLDKLAAGRGGGRGDEMRRYTFEGEDVVDLGPAMIRGGRGGGAYGGRGVGYAAGGYRGRGGGGGFRGGGYRDTPYRNNDWRDRRGGY